MKLSVRKILAMLLMAGGVLALVYRGFSYTQKSRTADLGPVAITLKDTGRITIPVWAGVALVGIGGALLLFERK